MYIRDLISHITTREVLINYNILLDVSTKKQENLCLKKLLFLINVLKYYYTNYYMKCHLNKWEYIFLYRSKFYLHSRSYGYKI